MNDFIVWDKCRKIWIDESYPFFINSSGFLCIQRNDKQMVIENDCEIFKPLGLTDIRGKSIYADSSIVEFEHKDKKLQGFFRYSKMRLSYVIEDLYNDMGEMVYDGSQNNFKTIDTIQENKLGLIK